ncbi:hypothetical protein [Brevundimonas sp.]|uniref:hypothetical protein n=1 Tax=Brevundimonas sp. TaxID=1871086 RepID=UPI00289A49B2|nr:hypothetical protein [Brevundimonas sp.]
MKRQDEIMTADRKSGVLSRLATFVGGVFIGWCAVTGGTDLWRSLQAGRFLNRRGPDIFLEDAPLVFWALSGFYGLAVLLAGGLCILCLLIALREAIGKTAP